MADKIICPACGQRTVEGAFCEKCGRDLSVPAAPLPDTPGETGACSPPYGPPDTDMAAAKPARGVKVEGEGDPSPRTVVFCPDLKVEYNMAALFVVGINMPFAFRITPQVDGLERIVVSIHAEIDGREWHKTKRLNQRPLKGKPFDHRVNFSPREGFGGVIAFEVHICFQKEGQTHSFETSTRHKVYPQQSKARDVMDTIIVNINNEINTGHAADISLRNGLDELQSLRNRTGEQETLQGIINQIFDFPAALCSLPIYPSNWLPPEAGGTRPDAGDIPPEGAQIDRVTLRAGDRLVHLFTDESITLGRSRENNLVTRNFLGAGVAMRDLNRGISRYHCRIELHGDRCFIVDGGFDPETGTARASGQGTYLNGVRLQPCGSAEATAGTPALLTLAGSDPERSGVLALSVRTIPCSRTLESECAMASDCEPGVVSGVYLERVRQDAPESYALLARCADLGDLMPALRGLVVWRRGGGIMYSTGKTRGWLIPGEPIAVHGRLTAVEPYRQWGL